MALNSKKVSVAVISSNADLSLKCDCFNCLTGLNSDGNFLGHVCHTDGCSKLFTTVQYLQEHLMYHRQKSVSCTWSHSFGFSDVFKLYLKMKAKDRRSPPSKKTQHLKTDKHAVHRQSNIRESCANELVVTRDVKMMNSQHVAKHNVQRLFVCDWGNCTMSYKQVGKLKQHRQKYHEMSKLNESSSNIRLGQANKGNICSCSNCVDDRHEPNAPKRHICDFVGCGKLFSAPSHLLIHSRVHTGERPFVCDFEHCTKSYKQAGMLKRHRRVHNLDKKYECLECGFKCHMLDYYMVHMMAHNNDGSQTPEVASSFDPPFDIKQEVDEHLLSKNELEPNTSIKPQTTNFEIIQNLSTEIKTESFDEYGEYEITEPVIAFQPIIFKWNSCEEPVDSLDNLNNYSVTRKKSIEI